MLTSQARFGRAVLLLLGWGFRAGVRAEPPSMVRIDGSSTLFPLTEAVAEEFQNDRQRQARIMVGISGTGGGFKKFCRGETDFQDASRPISVEEMESCRRAGVRYIELPVAFDAITLVVNPANPLNSITLADLKRIWEPAAQGKVQRWKQVRPEWPDEPLHLFGAGADSGTFDYFSEAINGKAKASRGDYTASEDDNTLVQGVSADRLALGFVPYAYYEANRARLKALAVVGAKAGVLPSPATVVSGAYSPLSRPLFLYVSAKGDARAEVRAFARFYLERASRLAAELKFVPLPAAAYEASFKHLERQRYGTVFKGHAQTGLTIEEILKRDASL